MNTLECDLPDKGETVLNQEDVPSEQQAVPASQDDVSTDQETALAPLVVDDADENGKNDLDSDQITANIFGDKLDDLDEDASQDDQERNAVDDEKVKKRNKRSHKKSEASPIKKRKPSDDEQEDTNEHIEWDFDRMMREKKAAMGPRRSRGRRDFVNDFDEDCALFIEEMKAAAKEDRLSNMERRPAIRKRLMLARVRERLRNVDLLEAHMENGMLVAISEWLAPLPDKSLPALEVRTDILKLLPSFGRIDQEALKQSGLGKSVMLIFKHPKETRDNKKLAESLITDWARPIFQLDMELPKEERAELDMQRYMKTHRYSEPAPPKKPEVFEPKKRAPRPGERGFIYRAVVPKPSTKEYVYRPVSKVVTPFHSETKLKATGWNQAMKEVKRRARESEPRVRGSKSAGAASSRSFT